MYIRNAQRITVKIGSSLLTDQEKGTLNQTWFNTVVDDIEQLVRQGKEVVVVSSGAMALGREPLGLGSGKLKLEEKQAAAACGQIYLSQSYQQSFARHGIVTAQLLLTIDDLESRRRYLNARNTLEVLLASRCVPVINENDTVVTMELRVGDNDRLAARVAAMTGSDLLIVLSDVDGLYTANPNTDPDAEHIKEVELITPEIEAMAGGAGSAVGTGGMITKIAAAQIATNGGCHMVIASGMDKHPLRTLEQTEHCTWFKATQTPLSARKHWIFSSLGPQGILTLDAGACQALKQGNSLLPVGVCGVEGSFECGDAVLLRDEAGNDIGKGISSYSSADAAKIMRHNSDEIEDILGSSGREVLVHRDDLALFP